jgi:DNA repair photolyase
VRHRDENERRRGRGATLNPANRYACLHREDYDDGWRHSEEVPPPLQTIVTEDRSHRVITYNKSPDVGFDRSINPYRGCEHGCVYCFARPTHAWLDLSPGLDFESRLFYKPDAPVQLRRELGARYYRCAPIAVGINTDAYQPIERRFGLTRSVLEVLVDAAHPFLIVTKSALVERDIDLIATAASRGLAAVAVTITTLNRCLARRMEPRAAAPQRRLATIGSLAGAGIPVTVMVAPVIPALTDMEMEEILKHARTAGARHASYTLLRLPHEIREMFADWLEKQFPSKADHVLSRVRDTRGGVLYDGAFHRRMTGRGAYADIIRDRFELATRRLGFTDAVDLDTSAFRRPRLDGQLDLFRSDH